MMLSILIIDDTPEKIKAIKNVVYASGIQTERLDIAVCVNQAIQKMHEHQYDLSLLDFYIPMDWDESSVPDPKNAISLLNEIAYSEEIYSPVRVLAITKAPKIENEHQTLLHKSNCILLNYSEESDLWREQLSKELINLKHLKSKFVNRSDYNYDVAIITALQYPENEQLRTVFGGDWRELKVYGDEGTVYYETELKNCKDKTIRIVTAYQHQMASVASSMLTTKMIYNFRPRYVFMTGIAASAKSSDEGVNYGDVLVATQVWDAFNGKIKETDEDPHLFVPDYKQLPLDADMYALISKIKEDKYLLNCISRSYSSSAHRPKTELDVHLGPMASVPAVIASQVVIDEIRKCGKSLLGIEMEAYGMFLATANSIKHRPKYVASLKSVSDYATKEKNDKYQEYAAYTSAAVLKHIVVNCLNYD